MTNKQSADIVEIMSLGTRYALSLDTARWHDLARVFAPDATMVFAGIPPATGPGAIAAVCEGALHPLDASQHLVGTQLVEVHGDTATSSCYFHAQHVRTIEGREEHYIVAGTYSDQAKRLPEGWRITHRTQTVTWSSGNPAVLNS